MLVKLSFDGGRPCFYQRHDFDFPKPSSRKLSSSSFRSSFVSSVGRTELIFHHNSVAISVNFDRDRDF